MSEEQDDLIASLSLNKILIAILKNVGEVRVPTLDFLENSNTDQELIVDYQDDPAMFIFKLKGKNE